MPLSSECNPETRHWVGNTAQRVKHTDRASIGVSLGFVGLFFTAGAILLIFLTLLGGTRNRNPLNQIYFLEADTGNIPGAPSISRWTFWQICGVLSDGRNNCGASHPDFPFDPPNKDNFGTTTNVPAAFIGYVDNGPLQDQIVG